MNGAPTPDPTETILTEFLEGAPRAQTWTTLRETLEERLNHLRQLDPETLAGMQTDLAVLEKQVQALREEEAISTFVESAVLARLARPSASSLMDDDEY